MLEATCSHTFGDLKNSLINSSHLEPLRKIKISHLQGWVLFRLPHGTKRTHGNMPFRCLCSFLGSPTDREDTRPRQLKPGLRTFGTVRTSYTVSAESRQVVLAIGKIGYTYIQWYVSP